MSISEKLSSMPRYSGKVLMASIMLVFVFIAFAVFLSYGARVVGFSKCDQAEARLGMAKSSKAPEVEKIGVVKGVVYNPPESCALIGE